MKILQKRNTKKISSRTSLRKLLVSRKQFVSKDSKGNTLNNLSWCHSLGTEGAPRERRWLGRACTAKAHPMAPSQGTGLTRGQAGTATAWVIPGDWDSLSPAWSMAGQGRAVVELKTGILCVTSHGQALMVS